MIIAVVDIPNTGSFVKWNQVARLNEDRHPVTGATFGETVFIASRAIEQGEEVTWSYCMITQSRTVG